MKHLKDLSLTDFTRLLISDDTETPYFDPPLIIDKIFLWPFYMIFKYFIAYKMEKDIESKADKILASERRKYYEKYERG